MRMNSVCYFCGSFVNHIRESESGKAYVVCDYCGATGPYASSPVNALEKWNNSYVMSLLDSFDRENQGLSPSEVIGLIKKRLEE